MNECSIFMQHLYLELSKQQYSQLVAKGVPEDLLKTLTEHGLIEQQRLISRAEKFISYSFDFESLKRELKIAKNKKDRHQIEREFIALDASADMMKTLFAMHPKVYTSLRKMADKTNLTKQRNYTDEQESQVISLWERLKGTDKDKYLDISKTTGISLRLVWKIITNQNNNKQMKINLG
ncbi:DUF2857 family protein [Endozoicomonas sp. SM1973]|uniref:DUF2857 family protein n=1 Tax=Spartinivicinus marinus TaxID=2994442 RepID=A0A853IF68_9GAMM|nr:STY4526/YPO1902 family pathogenicity island replication protein [Spartinivicinus marinus]MCX4030162.1 STY4526/YPO1902 family pathogenicity island replication protein [Spartinivicinus marinus]NYZ67805.1 DUF2857 family protein [Spartinivicinus marinus]